MPRETDCFPTGRARSALVLGGARSGKSAFAERLARETRAARVYVATARAWDDEMRARIDQHRRDRGADWETVEAPHDLADAIRAADGPGRTILVDCLTLWLTNRMLAEADCEAESAALADALPGLSAQVVFVSNELGMGLVPETPLGRAFRDAQGRLNQRMAAACDLAVFVAAGLPLVLKAPGR